MTITAGPTATPPPTSPPVAAVDEQIGRVRRRRNVFALQRLLAFPIALAASSVLLLIGLAFLLPESVYVGVAWLLAILWSFAVVRSLRGVRRSWMGRDAARRIDHSAALEERLTTLTALTGRRIDSRLWGHLVGENIRLLPSWTPERLTPRAVPWSLWGALGSVGVLIAILFFVLPSESESGFLPRPATRPGEAPGELEELPPGSDEEASGEGEMVDLSEILASLPEKLREEILRRAKQMPPGTTPPKGAKPAGKGRPNPNAAGGPGENDGKEQGQAKSQQMKPGDEKGDGKRPDTSLARRDRPRIDEGAPPPQPPTKGDGLKVLGQGAKPPPGTGTGGGAPGAGKGSDPGGLFGAPDGAVNPSGIFALDLDVERGAGEDGEEGQGGERADGPLAETHRIDDAVRRAMVPAAYEKVVERLFQRGERAKAAPQEP